MRRTLRAFFFCADNRHSFCEFLPKNVNLDVKATPSSCHSCREFQETLGFLLPIKCKAIIINNVQRFWNSRLTAVVQRTREHRASYAIVRHSVQTNVLRKGSPLGTPF
jgi:hypothetical protein